MRTNERARAPQRGDALCESSIARFAEIDIAPRRVDRLATPHCKRLHVHTGVLERLDPPLSGGIAGVVAKEDQLRQARFRRQTSLFVPG